MSDIQSLGGTMAADLSTGVRARMLRTRIAIIARRNGLDSDAAWKAVREDVMPQIASGTIRHADVAAKYGFDPQNWKDFIDAILPLVIQFMAMCGV